MDPVYKSKLRNFLKLQRALVLNWVSWSLRIKRSLRNIPQYLFWETYSCSHKTYGKCHISHIWEILPIFLIPKTKLIYLYFNLSRLPKHRLCVDMDVCPCICIHVYIYLCMFVSLCTYIHPCVYVSMSICMYLCMCVSASEFFPHHVKTEKGH